MIQTTQIQQLLIEIILTSIIIWFDFAIYLLQDFVCFIYKHAVSQQIHVFKHSIYCVIFRYNLDCIAGDWINSVEKNNEYCIIYIRSLPQICQVI